MLFLIRELFYEYVDDLDERLAAIRADVGRIFGDFVDALGAEEMVAFKLDHLMTALEVVVTYGKHFNT